MVDIISALAKQAMHKKTYNEPFLLRYRNEKEFTIIDHYRHLRQILPIYEALETKLKTEGFLPQIPKNLLYVLARSEEIKKDIEFLKPQVPAKFHDEIVEETTLYVEELKLLDTNSAEGQEKIFVHFLVRILGDLFGGQGLKTCVMNTYKKEQLYNDDCPEQGVNFYTFPPKAVHEIKVWLKDQIDENKTIEIANDSFNKHMNIFKKLESSRENSMPIVKPASNQSLFTDNRSSFFSCRNLTAAIAVVGAATIAGSMFLSANGP